MVLVKQNLRGRRHRFYHSYNTASCTFLAEQVIGSGPSFLVKPMLQPTVQQLCPRIGSGQVHSAKELVLASSTMAASKD